MTIFSILLAAHMLACGWFYVGSQRETGPNGHNIYGASPRTQTKHTTLVVLYRAGVLTLSSGDM